MMGAKIESRRIVSMADSAFIGLWSIYAEAIPQSEAKKLDEFSFLVSRSDYSVLVFEAGGKVVAFTMMFAPKNGNFALLEYMAVEKSVRGSGIGSLVFQEAISERNLAKQHEVVLVEVDSPRERGAKDRLIRSRRIDFYRRNGCRRIENLNYLFPLECNGPAPDMDLLMHSRERKSPVSREELREWLTATFVQVYGCEKSDRRIDIMMISQPDIILTEVFS